jgi:hypothetical protein
VSRKVGVGLGIAVFSPAAWRAAGKTAREAVLIVRNMAIAATVVVGTVAYWWQQQTQFVRIATGVGLATLLVLWARHRLGLRAVPRRPVRTVTRASTPTQVLYRWWEPTDLPYGLKCACGKDRLPGELVYVGITGAHRSRELDDDRQVACWWNQEPSVIGTQELFRTRAAVERAEIEAIRSEHPRENIAHAGSRPWH